MKNKWQIGLLILILLLAISGCSNTNDYVSSEDDASDNDDLAQENEVVSEVKVDDGSNQFDSSQYFDPQNIDASTLSTKYNIIADLDEENNVLKSDITIEYTNMTDDKLNDIQLIFPMKCLADNRTGLDLFDGTMNQERFEAIDFKIESIKIDGQEWAVDYTDSNLWKGSHHDLLNLPLDEGLDINDTSEIEIIYEYSLPLSDVLGVRDNKYAFSAWYPMIPFYQEGAWQGDYAHHTWYYHVPYSEISLDIKWDSPKSFLSIYNISDYDKLITELSASDVIDRAMTFYLIKDMNVKTDQIENQNNIYVYSQNKTLIIEENGLKSRIRKMNHKYISPKINKQIIVLLDDIDDQYDFNQISYSTNENSATTIQDDLEVNLMTNLLYPTFLDTDEESSMMLMGLVYYKMLHVFSYENNTDFEDYCYQYLYPNINYKDLKLKNNQELLSITDEKTYNENFRYKPTLLLVDLEKKYGEERMIKMITKLDNDFSGKALSFDGYISFIKNYFGDDVDEVLSKYL